MHAFIHDVKAPEVEKLARLIQENREAVLADWREKVRQLPSAKDLDTPVLNDHVPALLDELAAALIINAPDQTMESASRQAGPRIHGVQRFEVGFNIAEVVAEYGLLREVIKSFAERRRIT